MKDRPADLAEAERRRRNCGVRTWRPRGCPVYEASTPARRLTATRRENPRPSSRGGVQSLWWRLADIAAFVDELRRPHGLGADIAASLTYLTGYLESSRD
ncbi:hypothetical protein [Microtetraspora malaysiensis]|uniref:Uncharacterized protein n=1 Tax=Microtetraspora malaysiensis TaxID=161358 RepID=A0ABW6T3M3_9ACTN